MQRGVALTNLEIVELVGYKTDVWCIGCDDKLVEVKTGPTTPRYTCNNQQCPRYGLEALLGIEQKKDSQLDLSPGGEELSD